MGLLLIVAIVLMQSFSFELPYSQLEVRSLHENGFWYEQSFPTQGVFEYEDSVLIHRELGFEYIFKPDTIESTHIGADTFELRLVGFRDTFYFDLRFKFIKSGEQFIPDHVETFSYETVRLIYK